MAWNEPGGNGKDPWGNRRNDGPPDLDEVFKNLQNKLSGLFGGRGNRGGSSGGFSVGAGLIAIILFAVWGLSGVYIVDEGERGVVLQFGKHIDTTQPGPHWYMPVVQSVEIVQVSAMRSVEDSAQVLTGDENIVQVNYTVQYNIKSAGDYLFNVEDPDDTLRRASESAFREIIGKNTLDYVIKDGRDEVPTFAKALLQENLDAYGAGLDVITVNLIEAQPPQEVQGALNDANKAREDKERFIKEAEAYRNDVIPKARGDAREQIEKAKAYKVKIVKSAEGEAVRFEKLLEEYERAPKVTRERLYLETIESVLANTGKVLVDVKNGNNLMYLPLDKIINNGRVYIESLDSGQPASSASQQQSTDGDAGRAGLRSREIRR